MVQQVGNPPYDLLITKARLIDGTGGPSRNADLAVRGDRIAQIADWGSIDPTAARRVVDATGLVLAPGFVDSHTHDDFAVIGDPAMRPKVTQGVTTVVVGNCGISGAPIRIKGDLPAPPLNLLGDSAAFAYDTFAEYADKVDATRPAVNVAALIGHGTLRVATMPDFSGRASAGEIDRMRSLLADSLDAGAIGLSTGLFYPINSGADADEVVALAEIVSEKGGVYTTHMRDEYDRVIESLEETFETGRRAKVPVVISHHKCALPENYGRTKETLPLIAAAAEHQAVGLDAYPYDAGSTVLYPEEARDDVRIMITWSTPHPEMSGRDLSDIAKEWGCSQREAGERLLPAGAIYFQMDEADVRAILKFPLTMIGSDGLPHDRHPHPRLWGTFPRILGHYARDVGLFSLEQAVHKMTGLTARRFGLADRGLLREGYAADLVLFDPAKVKDTATYAHPIQPAEGISAVYVNGQLAMEGAAMEGARAGRLLRKA
jgi:N-acyl-D-aspartate/D-glutamate deacylase